MDYAIIIVPAAPVRRKARHQTEMTNQLLFGEAVKVYKTKGSLWVKVRSLADGYEGWMTRNLLQQVNEEEAKQPVQFMITQMAATISFDGMKMQVPFGASLPGFSNGQGKIGDTSYTAEAGYEQSGSKPPGAEFIRQVAIQWLNVPYMWGGKTFFGADCSGFVQTCFKILGIDLPRDAWQQAQEGKEVQKLKEATGGELAFFDDKEEIVHVGILLGNDQIIHASGKVRIDTIDKKGIINSTTGKRTHSLRVIKKLW